MVKEQLPQHRFRATGGFRVDSLAGVEVLIPTMCPITREILADADRLQLIQQCGSGLEGVDIAAASGKRYLRGQCSHGDIGQRRLGG